MNNNNRVKHGRQSFGSLKPYNNVKENTGWKRVYAIINNESRRLNKLKGDK